MASNWLMDCIFCKIAKKEILKEFIYKDQEMMVFPDINPIAPVHLLIMPKKHIVDFLDLEDNLLFGKLKTVIQKLIKNQKLEDRGYKIIVNGGGAQIINHLHFHLIGPLGKKVSIE